MKQQAPGLKRIVNATIFSIAGLRAAWRNEAAFRQECLLAAFLIPAAFWLGQTTVERLLLLVTVCLVLIVELLNSAVEAAVDRMGTEHHELAGRAKDLGSASVFVSMVLVLLVWGIIGWQRFAG